MKFKYYLPFETQLPDTAENLPVVGGCRRRRQVGGVILNLKAQYHPQALNVALAEYFRQGTTKAIQPCS